MINLRQEALDALVDKALGTTSLIGIPTVVRRGLFVTRKWPRRLLTFVPRSPDPSEWNAEDSLSRGTWDMIRRAYTHHISVLILGDDK